MLGHRDDGDGDEQRRLGRAASTRRRRRTSCRSSARAYEPLRRLAVREHRHRPAAGAAEQRGAPDRRAAEAVAHRVERVVDGDARAAVERQPELHRVGVAEVGDRDPDQREPTRRRSVGRASVEELAQRASRSGSVSAVGSAQRRRARDPGEVVEAQPEHDGVADDAAPTRSRRATPSSSSSSMAAISARGRRPRPSARCAPIDRRRRPGCTGRGSRLCASACRWWPDAGPSMADQHVLAERGDLARRVVMPRSWSLARGRRADAPEAVDGERVQELELVRRAGRRAGRRAWRRRDATLARNLVRAPPTVMRKPDPVEHVAPELRGDRRRPGPTPGAARRRRGRPRRSRCPRRAAGRRPEHRRTPPGSPRCTPTCAAARRSRAGHSARAWRPPIAPRTPKARAS